MPVYVLKAFAAGLSHGGEEYVNCSTIMSENKQALEEDFNFHVGLYQKICDADMQTVVKMTFSEVTPSGPKCLREFNITKG